jgi:hypothetical protein
MSRKKKAGEEPEAQPGTDTPSVADAELTQGRLSEGGSETPPEDEIAAKDRSPARGQRTGLELPRYWPATLLGLVVAAFLVGALAAYWPRITGQSDAARIAALEQRIAQLTGGAAAPAPAATGGNQEGIQRRMESVETRLGTLERNAPTIFNEQAGGTLDGRVTGLEQSRTETAQTLAALVARVNSIEAATPTDLPQRLNSFALGADVAQMDARLRQVEALRHAAVVLALARLARAGDEAQPYLREFRALQIVAPGDPSIPILEPHAETGVPTLAMLTARFPEAARNAIRAERLAMADGFWSRLWARFRNFVSIRRITAQAGEDSESRLARAQSALGRGDLATAVDETSALDGAAATTMEPWLTDARARLSVERAITEIGERVTQLLAVSPPALPAVPNPTPVPAAPGRGAATQVPAGAASATPGRAGALAPAPAPPPAAAAPPGAVIPAPGRAGALPLPGAAPLLPGQTVPLPLPNTAQAAPGRAGAAAPPPVATVPGRGAAALPQAAPAAPGRGGLLTAPAAAPAAPGRGGALPQ